ncbi:unnamed protein product [marine sediment metagenome]|uniref:Uncharacterized protein n=1 Tax=marine sediment metagenome TaxID=412755 RepID=X1MG07_9ZZZZ
MPAGQPKIATGLVDAAADTYYTLLDYAGKGAFSNIYLFQQDADINLITIKITVDGGAPLEILLGDDQLYRVIRRDCASAVDKHAILGWGLVSFATSLKIEYKCTVIHRIVIACMYQTYA